MDRRQFVGTAAGALATAALEACARRIATPSTIEPPAAPLDAAAYKATRRFVDTPYGRIAYVERGSGRAALFVHGYPLNGFQWRGALDRLSLDRRCIAPDLMGLGYSDVPEGQSVAPDQQVAMLNALLDRLSVSRVDLIGNDSGGAICQLFVARHARRVRTLLLTNCDAINDCPPPSFQPAIQLAKSHQLADLFVMPQLANKDVARGPKGLGGLAYTYPDKVTDEMVDYYFSPLVTSPLRKLQFENYALALEPNVLAGVEPGLHQFTGPVRIVWGMGDTTFSKADADWLDHAFPHSRGVRRVDGAQLFFPEEMPDVIAEESRTLWGV